MSRMMVAARSLMWQNRPPYRWGVMWSCQYWRRTAIQDHITRQRMQMSSKWPPVGMSGSSPLSAVMVCVNSGVRSHLRITGTGKVSWSFQCWVPHSMVASTSAANFWAWSPNDDRHLTASWSGLRVRKIMVACLLMYDWAFFNFRPLTSGIWTSHLRVPSARHPVHPFVWYSSGTDRAPLIHAVMAKLLVYGVRVYHAAYPHHACDSSTSFYSYCAFGFYSAGDLFLLLLRVRSSSDWRSTLVPEWPQSRLWFCSAWPRPTLGAS